MTKKGAGRQKVRLSIKPDVLRQRIAVLGMDHPAIVRVGEDTGVEVGISSLRNALTEKIASPNVIRAFAHALNLSPFAFVVDAEEHREVLADIDRCIQTNERQRIHTKGQMLGGYDLARCVQDKKNLIRSPGMSRSLLTGIGVPSLYEAVLNSVTFTPIDDEHKDVPFVPGMDYNHFLMIGAVVIINTPEVKAVAGYHRSPGHLQGTYEQTSGLSIVWAAGFEFNLKDTRDRDMWGWMESASQSPEQAENAFIGKQNPVLLRLLSHKLNLNPQQCSINPLCVVTYNMRPTRERVYTHYLFEIEVNAAGRPRSAEQLMAEIVQEPDLPVAIRIGLDQRNPLEKADSVNPIDQVVWQRLQRKNWKEPPESIRVSDLTIC